MEDFENKLGQILGNPEMMQKIMAMAQSLNNSSAPEQPKQDTGDFSIPDIDLGMVQKLSGLAGQANIDNDQRTLLKALTPYLNRERIHKLENAMRAAKMARLAAATLGGNFNFIG